jgi:2,3-bisphosphoglycerate-independent phosphoglycerate mutase
VSDQWLPPFVITDEAGKPVGTVEDCDAVVLFNFRADRMVEISKAFEYPDFDIFDRERYPKVRACTFIRACMQLIKAL